MALRCVWARYFLALVLLLSLSQLLSAQTASGGADKLATLRRHAAKAGDDQLLPFSDKSLDRFADVGDRPYGLVILFTANNCPACNFLKKALISAQRAAKALPEDTPLFFAEILHDKCPKTFAKVGIRQTPVLLYLPHQASGESKHFSQYPIESMEHLTSPDMVVNWLAQASGLPLSIPQPLWKNPNVQNTLIAVALFVFLYKLPALLRNWNHPLVFFFGTLCVYAFTFSGVIYNAINKLPWSGFNHYTGEPELFLGEMRAQYAGEGVIIASVNVITCIFLILLVAWAPKIEAWWLRLPLSALFLSGVVFLWMAQARMFYTHKAHYYPFKI